MTKFTVAIGESVLKYNYPATLVTAMPQYRNVAVRELSFSSQLFGGYWAAAFDMEVESSGIDDLSELPGADVVIWDEAGVEVWNGFIDTVSLSHGAAAIQMGPVMGVSNYIQIAYREYSFNVNPPVYNGDNIYPPSDDNSEWLSNAPSIRNWGHMYEVISAGREMSAEEAERAGLLAITDRSALPVSADISPTAVGTDTARVECLGYFHLTKKRYVDLWDGGMYPADVVFRQAMGTLSVLRVDRMAPCAIQIPLWTEDRQNLYDFLEANYKTLGDGLYYGFSFGVYDSRIVRLDAIRTGLGITSARPVDGGPIPPPVPDFYISADSGLVVDVAGNEMSANVRPGAWVQPIGGASLGTKVMGEMFIAESVEYNGGAMVINRMKFSMLDRLLQQRGV